MRTRSYIRTHFVLQGGGILLVRCFCSRYIIQHPVSNSLKWRHSWLLSAQRGFIELGCSLEAIPQKIRFMSEKLPLNSSPLYGSILFSWIFFPWNTVWCFILRFGPVLFSFKDADIIRTSRGGGGGGVFKTYIASRTFQQRKSSFSTFLINGFTSGSGFTGFRAVWILSSV